MLTIPMLDWIAKVGPNREKLASFSVAKYGPQQKTDPYMPDAGNGNKPDGKPIAGTIPPTPTSPTASPSSRSGCGIWWSATARR